MPGTPDPYAKFAAKDGKLSLQDFVKSDSAKNKVEMVPYDRNCVAMSLSRCLGVNIFATVNFLKNRGLIAKGTDLENDGAVSRVAEGLQVTKQSDKASWISTQAKIRGAGNGRYFCVNNGPEDASASFIVHAFTVFCAGVTINVHGNNQDTNTSLYRDFLSDTHRVSAWGPFPT